MDQHFCFDDYYSSLSYENSDSDSDSDDEELLSYLPKSFDRPNSFRKRENEIGSEVDSKGSSEQYDMMSSALQRAVSEGNYECSKVLLARGANPNSEDELGRTPLHTAFFCSQESSRKLAELLLRFGAKPHVPDLEEIYPIHLAVENCDLECVKLLVERGANVNQRAVGGYNPLFIAAMENKTEIMVYLMNKGADPKTAILDDGGSPLFEVAGRNNKVALLRMLEEGADPNAKDNFGDTPLTYAILKGTQEMVSLLLSHGAKINEGNKKGQTPLHDSVFKKSASLVSFLLENGADPNLKNSDQLTPLELAIKLGQSEIVSTLLSGQGTARKEKTTTEIALYHTNKKLSKAISNQK